ncbi:uncharacterized protein LOC126457390 [Schistocerca serialis cubense]|uniref:uncharacterized protein LOC126457390 n=1 Tax=Schistocerca serialis cubense TaxID=2023355 RepID=UPI00214DF211|nr:uncharacterized protein LOC126457390 [Schistocerca serialis cubense]
MHGRMQKLLYQTLLLFLLCFHCGANDFFHKRHFQSHTYSEIKDTVNSKHASNCAHLQIETSNKQTQAELTDLENHESWSSIPVQTNEVQNSYGTKHNSDLLYIDKKKMYQRKKMDDFSSKNSNSVLYGDTNKLTLFKESSLETLVDFAIDMLNQKIKREGNSKIKIPDINETFYEQVGPLKVKGEFCARKGWFHSLSSLYRTDQIYVSRGGNILTVLISVGLKEMFIDYDDYKFKFMKVGPTGKIEAQVVNNSIEMILTVDISGSGCKIKLSDIKITTFSGLKMHVTGLGRLSFFVSKVTTWIIELFHEEIKEKAERILARALEGVLDNIKC